jgi:hypothetical protein
VASSISSLLHIVFHEKVTLVCSIKKPLLNWHGVCHFAECLAPTPLSAFPAFADCRFVRRKLMSMSVTLSHFRAKGKRNGAECVHASTRPAQYEDSHAGDLQVPTAPRLGLASGYLHSTTLARYAINLSPAPREITYGMAVAEVGIPELCRVSVPSSTMRC